jgi:uncharacterized glyoxalase superfamily protein PhnB
MEDVPMIMPNFGVKDLNASLTFYTEKLGFDTMMTMPGPNGGDLVFAIVRWGEQVVIGLGFDDRIDYSKPLGHGVQFMIYPPDGTDIDQYYADVKGRGVAITEELQDSYWGDRVFSINDPDGYWLTFAVTKRQVPVDEMVEVLRQREDARQNG